MKGRTQREYLSVRWLRPNALPNCPSKEMVLEIASLAFAGKSSQLER
jgi:hypothetical protein